MKSKVIEICEKIDNEWLKLQYDYKSFPHIAKKEISKYDLVKEFNYVDILSFLDDNYTKSIQISSSFSDLHIKLFDNGKFYVEVLTWLDSDTTIHDHGFTGVLLQLAGSSLNVSYDFVEKIQVSQDFVIGEKMELEGVEILNPGDYHNVYPGRNEKHAVYHLDKMTVSIIFRTHPITELPTQLNYFPPYIRINHAVADLVFKKKINFLMNLWKTFPEKFNTSFLAATKKWSYAEVVWAILKLSKIVFSKNHVDILKYYLSFSINEEDKRIREMIITSCTYRVMSKKILDNVKYNKTDNKKRLILSSLAACYSKIEVRRMSDLISYDLTCMESLDSLCEFSEKEKDTIASACNILHK